MASRSSKILWATLAMAVLLVFSPSEARAMQIVEAIVDVGQDGYANINMTINVNQTEVTVAVPFLGQPESFTIKATSKDDTPLSFSMFDNYFILNVVDTPSPIRLQYSTSTLTSKSGRFWNITLQLTHQILLKLPKKAFVIGVDGVPEDIFKQDEKISMILAPRLWKVSYFIPPATQEQTLTINPLWIIGGVAGAAVLVLALKRLRRSGHYALRPDDRRILEYINSVGGEAYESDIVQELDLPKTSVWRAIRRLSEANLVSTVKEGNRNKVRAK